MKFMFVITIALLLRQHASSSAPTGSGSSEEHNNIRHANIRRIKAIRPDRSSRQSIRDDPVEDPLDDSSAVGRGEEVAHIGKYVSGDRQDSIIKDIFNSDTQNATKLPCPSKEDHESSGSQQLDCDPIVKAPASGTEIISNENATTAPSPLPNGDSDGDDFFDFDFFFNFTPPCPPQEVLAILNLTVDDLGCDTTWLPPCPPEQLAGDLGMNQTIDCDPDFDFFNHIFFNGTDLPCPFDESLAELEAYFGFTCNPNVTWFNGTDPWSVNYTTLECEAPITCSVFGGELSGIFACPFDAVGFEELFSDYDLDDINWSMCILPSEAIQGDVCGCCGGECPKPCTDSKCKVPYTSPPVTGVWVADIDGGYAECVTESESITRQLDGYSTCLNTCSS